MPMVDGKEYPYTPKGMAAAKKARKGAMTGSGMMNSPQAKKMDAMRNAISKVAAKKSNMPAKVGDSGMKSNMPMKKGEAKKRNLEY